MVSDGDPREPQEQATGGVFPAALVARPPPLQEGRHASCCLSRVALGAATIPLHEATDAAHGRVSAPQSAELRGIR